MLGFVVFYRVHDGVNTYFIIFIDILLLFFKLFFDVAKQLKSPREFDLLLRGLGLWPI